MRTLAFIFARGGSKGVPRKNVRQLGGKPLLGHALSIANKTREIERSFVSTDCDEIASVAKSYGATVIERPSELAQDNSPEWFAWRHAIEWVKARVGSFERLVSLPATAPLRLVEDVETCLDALDEKTDAVLTMTPAQRSPWFNMVKVNDTGCLTILVDENKEIFRRQDSPIAYDLTTLAYVIKPDFIMNNDNLWQGQVRGVVIPQERAIDIDTEFDFKIADYLMRERLIKGNNAC